MQFKLFAFAALAATAVADLQRALEIVDMTAIQLNATLGGNGAEETTLASVSKDAVRLVIDMETATEFANISAVLDRDAALAVADTTGTLASDLGDVVDGFIRNRPSFDRLIFITPIIGDLIIKQRAAAKELSVAILAKIPKDLANATAIHTKEIDDKFAQGIKAYA
ncbi:hypothetical protein LLEC1_02976 [Akanthomyces lecanii]|uniref:Antigenic cell wall galactomannoprotein n=1 Tax=Cordyceps confragosa TaxID=2714763 RepID=A0A179IUS8_CORDF|nr:hypothetical protein LLEC1_02976 [Akanthomyces lecanii]